ncbi:MAG: amidohydrolase family protein [Xanthobacteraceae bacterium]
MDLIADRGRRVTIEELNTTRLLAHARKQAHARNFDDVLIVDVDAHHYENENYDEFLPYMENDVLRQLTVAGRKRNRSNVAPTQIGYQDMGGRVTRYPMRSTEKTEEGGSLRDVQLGHRWMDAMSVDYSCLFPTGMLNIGMHPQKEMEVELCWAYNRWLTEKVLPESGGRFYSMLCLPFSDPEAALRHVETFGDRKHVGGFMVTTVRSHMAVYDNAYMKLYRAMEERGLVLSFHSGPNWGEPIYRSCNRFLSAHALGFTWYNILQCTNWVINGMGERFPKLPVIWIESGVAWVPFLMQRLDHEYMIRPSEAPLLKKKPSDYMRDMYYSSQPMEIQDYEAMECTFRMMKAETQLLYSSDYPHWDFDLPSVIYDLPFLNETQKRAILGGNALRVFGMEPPKRKLAVMD